MARGDNGLWTFSQTLSCRGRLVACIQNRSFDGGGQRLETQTLVPGVQRVTKGVKNP